MKILIIILALLVPYLAYAQTSGVGVQVNEGAPVPTVAALTGATNPGDDVRDILGWHKSELSPGVYALPAHDAALYAAVSAAGLSNVVTLYSCSTLYCPQTSSFPQTSAQIKAFANWACWVVSEAGIPQLRAVTIWNEMNGAFGGGIVAPVARQLAMAKLLKVVVPAIRSCNPYVAIYAGAFVSDATLAPWFCHIQQDGFNWALVDGLDIHPYLSGDPADAVQNGKSWRSSVVGKAGLLSGCGGTTAPITRPLYFSEWGGPALQIALAKNYFPTASAYFAWFDATVASLVPVTGRDYFLLGDFGAFPAQGLYTADDAQLTATGTAYRTRYVATE